MAVGVVAEYNPFHSGHRVHLSWTRERAGGGPVLAVMSGNAVQRGRMALYEKHLRTRAALENGADLVVELPAPWALSSAEGFARGAVSLLLALGCDSISFGSESGDEAALRTLADALASDDMDNALRRELGAGKSYGEARQRAAEALLGEGASLLHEPNDLLAAEYLAAAKRLGAELTPFALRRLGAEHHGATPRDGYASAGYLRQALERGESVAGLVPAPWEERYRAAPRSLREREEAVLLSLMRTLPQEAFDALPGGEEGFGRRLSRAARQAESLEALYAEAKTRRYAHARIRRLVLWAALGMREGDADGLPPYLRVLGANERGRQHLRNLNSDLPVITKPAAVRDLGGEAERIFELEARLTDLFSLTLSAPEERGGGREFRLGPVLL